MLKFAKIFVMRTIFPIIFFVFLLNHADAQQNDLYVPSTLNNPLFDLAASKEFQFNNLLNNYGTYHSIAFRNTSNVFILEAEHNAGSFKFDPLNFNDYYEDGQEKHLIASYPERTLTAGIAYGKSYNLKHSNLTLIAGISNNFFNDYFAPFIQMDFGNESKYVLAGAAARLVHANIEGTPLMLLQPALNGKLKILSFRLVHQFAYCLPLKRHHDYMKPVFSFGLEYSFKK